MNEGAFSWGIAMPPKSMSMQLSFLFVVGFSTDTSLRKQAKKRHIWLQFQLRKSVGKLFADSLNFQNFVFRYIMRLNLAYLLFLIMKSISEHSGLSIFQLWKIHKSVWYILSFLQNIFPDLLIL